VNVLGDSFGAGIVQRLSRDELNASHDYPEDQMPNGEKNGDVPNGKQPGTTVIANIDADSETYF
jgi:hypothetical protein